MNSPFETVTICFIYMLFVFIYIIGIRFPSVKSRQERLDPDGDGGQTPETEEVPVTSIRT